MNKWELSSTGRPDDASVLNYVEDYRLRSVSHLLQAIYKNNYFQTCTPASATMAKFLATLAFVACLVGGVVLGAPVNPEDDRSNILYPDSCPVSHLFVPSNEPVHFTTPNFPRPMTVGGICHTEITTSPGRFLVIHPVRVDLAGGDKVNLTDYLPNPAGVLLGQYIGSVSDSRLVSSSGYWVHVFLDHGGFTNRAGFHFRIWSEPLNATVKPTDPSYMTQPWTTIRPVTGTPTRCSVSSINVTGDAIVSFTTFEYPRNYANNLDCITDITTTAGRYLVFAIVDIDTEVGLDILVLNDRQNGRDFEISRYSGQRMHHGNNWPLVWSAGRTVRARFTTDSSTVFQGFNLRIWSQVSDGQNPSQPGFTTPSGVIPTTAHPDSQLCPESNIMVRPGELALYKSPIYANNNQRSARCFTNITTEDGHYLLFLPIRLQMGQNRNQGFVNITESMNGRNFTVALYEGASIYGRPVDWSYGSRVLAHYQTVNVGLYGDFEMRVWAARVEDFEDDRKRGRTLDAINRRLQAAGLPLLEQPSLI